LTCELAQNGNNRMMKLFNRQRSKIIKRAFEAIAKYQAGEYDQDLESA